MSDALAARGSASAAFCSESVATIDTIEAPTARQIFARFRAHYKENAAQW